MFAMTWPVLSAPTAFPRKEHPSYSAAGSLHLGPQCAGSHVGSGAQPLLTTVCSARLTKAWVVLSPWYSAFADRLADVVPNEKFISEQYDLSDIAMSDVLQTTPRLATARKTGT